MTYSKRQAELLGLNAVRSPPKPKRPLETPAANAKKRKTSSFGKRSIETIKEAPEETSSPLPAKRKSSVSPVLAQRGRERKISKTFQEDDSWD